MGLENREYFRDGTYSYTDRLTGFGLEFTPVVKYLILANVIVFLLQIFLLRTDPLGPLNAAESRFGPPQAEPDKAAAETKKAPAPAPKSGPEAIDWEKHEEAMRKAKRIMERVFAGHIPGMRVSIVQEWFELDPEKTVYQG